MNYVAMKMLLGDRAKYLGLVFAVGFSAMLMAHQASIFWGVMRRTTSQIVDVKDASIWVMDPRVKYVDEVWPLPDSDLYRVRGVEGVDWAVRFFRGTARAKTEDGGFQAFILVGFDDSTLAGAPRSMTLGSFSDLRNPDAVAIDEDGYRFLWPGEPFRLGRTLEMNDRRAVIVGVVKSSAPFQPTPVVYTRFSQAIQFVGRERNMVSFILANPRPGQSTDSICRRITERTGLAAMTRDEFIRKTIRYYIQHTGIPVNFGITVALAFIVGAVVAGQTFYIFTIENLKQFGALKAIGVTNSRITGMILLQALVVGLMGFAVGMGLTAAFFETTKNISHLRGFYLMWEVMAGTGASVMTIIVLSSLLSIRRVYVLEPAYVFRGGN